MFNVISALYRTQVRQRVSDSIYLIYSSKAYRKHHRSDIVACSPFHLFFYNFRALHHDFSLKSFTPNLHRIPSHNVHLFVMFNDFFRTFFWHIFDETGWSLTICKLFIQSRLGILHRPCQPHNQSDITSVWEMLYMSATCTLLLIPGMWRNGR